jgi:Ca2+-dependent lipid-binding protein
MSQLPLAPLNPILLEQSISSRHYNTMSQKVIKPIQKKRIEIEIIAATLTHNTELFGNMSPYCSLIYENEVRTTKVASRAGKNPVWNESFSFAIKDSNLLKI